MAAADDNDKLKEYVDREFQQRFRLPLSFIAPLFGTVVLSTAAAVWWVHTTLSPIDVRLSKLETTTSTRPAIVTDGVYPQPVVEQHFLADTDDEPKPDGSDPDADTLDDVAYMIKTRPDLVVIVAGFSTRKLPLEQSFVISQRRATNIGDLLFRRGIPRNRIFTHGYGRKVPLTFPICKHTSAAIFLCDIFQVMSRSTI